MSSCRVSLTLISFTLERNWCIMIVCSLEILPSRWNLSLSLLDKETNNMVANCSLNALTAVGVLVALIDFTLPNAGRFYSSMGNPLAVKGLREFSCIIKCKRSNRSRWRSRLWKSPGELPGSLSTSYWKWWKNSARRLNTIPRNARYISKTIHNEIITTVRKYISSNLLHEVREANTFPF